jgi:polyisoprenoid-binding protein YceI
MLARLALASSLFPLLAFAAPAPQAAKGDAKSKETKDAPSGRYAIDPVHTETLFKVKHMGVSNFYGRFNQASGTVFVDAETPADSQVKLTIDVGSFDTANADRDRHMKGPDFFNAEQFPKIVFESTKVTPKAGSKDQFDLAGNLTMHGVTKEITATIEQTGFAKLPAPMGGGSAVGYETKLTIKRSDFGLTTALDMLGDEVTVLVSLEAGKK